MWEPNKAQFSKHFRVITIDLPGFGKSAPAGEIATMDFMAESVRQTLLSTGINEKKVFVGLSMGGYVLMRLLKTMSDQVRAGIFVSTRAGADSPEIRAKRFKNIELVEKEGVPAFVEKQLSVLLGKTAQESSPVTVQLAREIALESSATAINAALRGMAGRPDSSDLLKRADFPMLFMAGTEDNVIAPTEMEQLSKLRSGSEFELIQGAGHLLNLEQRNAFHEAVSTFLKRKVL